MKKEPMEDDRDRDAWLGPMLRQTPQSAPDPCVDPDTLAAWVEGKLDARQASAVELHASNCARCMAMLAAIERSTPAKALDEGRSWAIGPLWRWIVPLTAAATAVAIWVAVPNRETTQVPSTAQQRAAAPPPATQDSARSSEPARQDAARELAPPVAPVPGTPIPEAKTAPSPTVDRLEERSAASGLSRDDAQAPADEKRERTTVDAFSPPVAPPAMPAPPPAPSAAPVPEPAATTAARRGIAAPTVAGAAPMNQSALAARQVPAPTEPVVTNMAAAPSNPLVVWRVVDWTSVERSIDGGNTWIKTTVPPGVTPDSTPRLYVVSIRVIDNLRGAVLTSDRTEFYTVNGGVSWERVQENSVAPF